MKRTVLTREGIRRLVNCSPDLPEARRNEIMSNYMQKLYNSGYDEKYRLQILKSSINAYKVMVEKDKTGERFLHRSREYKRDERDRDKARKEKDWFRSSKEGKNEDANESVIFIPATPGGELGKAIRKVIKEEKMKIKVVENPGTMIKDVLVKADPLSDVKLAGRSVLCAGVRKAVDVKSPL